MDRKIGSPSLNAARHGALAVFTALLMVASVLLFVPEAGAQTALTVEVPQEELHHATRYVAQVTGLKTNETFSLNFCVGDRTGPECPVSTEGPKGSRANPRLRINAKRLLLADGQVVDCALSSEPCWLEIRSGDRSARAQLRFSDNRPLPELFIEPQPVTAGEPVTVTANNYLHPRAGGNSGRSVYQCRSNRKPYSTAGCVRLGSQRYNESATVTPRRTLLVGRNLVDCAAALGRCELVLGSELQLEGTPLQFVPVQSPAAPSSVHLTKADDLQNYEPVRLVVRTSIRKYARVAQCVEKLDEPRLTCNTLIGTRLRGDFAGKAIAHRRTIRPRRFIVEKAGSTLDCADTAINCFVMVKPAAGNQPMIGERLPISFDPDEDVEPPSVNFPKGPFIDGQEVEIAMRGFLPGTEVRVWCYSPVDSRCANPVVTTTDETTGNAVIRITVKSTLTDDLPCVERIVGFCRIRVTTKPSTAKFTSKFRFT